MAFKNDQNFDNAAFEVAERIPESARDCGGNKKI
jgi:hypothetical protein